MEDFKRYLQGVADSADMALAKVKAMPEEEDNAHYYAVRSGMIEGQLKATIENLNLLLRIYGNED